jgi:hypothetical protein
MRDRDTKQRLEQMPRGAFSGPLTPLKDIPKRNGESRELKVASSPISDLRGNPLPLPGANAKASVQRS